MERGRTHCHLPFQYSPSALLSFILIVSGAQGSRTPGLAHRTQRTITSTGSYPISPTNVSESEITEKPKTNLEVPYNLLFKSYNMNTTLFWDYNITSPTPHFQVQIKDYKEGGNWNVVRSCKKILQNYCDLSKKFDDPDIFYKARVKAFVGTKESDYCIANDFSLRIHGKIGPPTLNASVENTDIIVDIWHPVTPLKQGNDFKTIFHFYDDFNYAVFYNNQTLVSDSQCDEFGCTAYLKNIMKDKTYCISAQGKSVSWVVDGEKSHEICLYVENKNFMTQNIVIGIIVTSCCVLLSLVIGITLLLKSNVKIPPSLTSFAGIVRGSMNTQQETRCDPLSINPEGTNTDLEAVFEAESPVNPLLDTSDTRQTDEPGYRTSFTGTGNNQISDNGQEPRGTSDYDARSIEELKGSSYFHTDSGNDETPLDSETINMTENTPLSEARCPNNSSGYDKPHAPLDML
ncbi:interferon gamma receptor 1 [Xenopus laevis]|uniref:Interferon gamma receptor 1 n=2 Tax=Xenopus laevis TaxID=8355 RepID=A0A1L8G2F8_XENLA|nr:interferon gamma receptor 1 [Xenopus laevis]OCT78004.1 hypothetical protein XELAEV_18029101mg [Xenopus laevis]